MHFLGSVRAAALEEVIPYAHGCCGGEQGLGLLWHLASNSPAHVGCFGGDGDPCSFPSGDTVLLQHVLMRWVQRTPAGCMGLCLPRAATAGVITVTFSFVSHLPLNLPFLFLLTTLQLCI